MPNMHRRTFLKTSGAFVCPVVFSGAATAGASASTARLQKAVQYRMLPGDLSHEDKCRLARTCGYEGIEISVNATRTEPQARELGKVARDCGVPIHSIVFGGWGTPLSDPDPDVVEKGLTGMRQCLRNAQAMGAGAVLLVPARVTETVRYVEAYRRSQDNIGKLISTAEETGVVIAVENVWNKFLLSPIEFARYIDQFRSRWVQAYFDVGNVIIFGYAQDWIRTLKKRIVRIHLKDFKGQGYQWKNLLDGDVNWPQVRKALDEIGYKGYVTPELSRGDEAYLKDLSGRIDRIIAGEF